MPWFHSRKEEVLVQHHWTGQGDGHVVAVFDQEQEHGAYVLVVEVQEPFEGQEHEFAVVRVVHGEQQVPHNGADADALAVLADEQEPERW